MPKLDNLIVSGQQLAAAYALLGRSSETTGFSQAQLVTKRGLLDEARRLTIAASRALDGAAVS